MEELEVLVEKLGVAVVVVEKLVEELEIVVNHLHEPRAPPPRVHLRLRLGLGQ